MGCVCSGIIRPRYYAYFSSYCTLLSSLRQDILLCRIDNSSQLCTINTDTLDVENLCEMDGNVLYLKKKKQFMKIEAYKIKKVLHKSLPFVYFDIHNIQQNQSIEIFKRTCLTT